MQLIKTNTNIPITEIRNAIELTLNANIFQYRNKFYKKIFGCATALPTSNVITK